MPSFTNQIADLEQVGPIVEILVSPSSALREELVRQKKPVPVGRRALAMIDTGPDATVLAPGVVRALGIHPIGVAQMNTPSTTSAVEVQVYEVSLTFPDGVDVERATCVEAPLGEQPIQCLIGRDILQHAVLVYIGYANQFTLSF